MEYPSISSYRGLIFDLDGTLINSMPLHVSAWVQVCKEHGIELNPQMIYDMGGVSSRDVVITLRDQGNEVGDIDAFVARKVQLYRDHIHEVKSFKKVEDILRKAKADGKKIGVGSGTQLINASYILNSLNLTDLIDALVTSEDVKNHKPHPDTFLLCAQKLGLKPDECVIFEDGPLGVQSALNGGFDCIEVDCGECKNFIQTKGK